MATHDVGVTLRKSRVSKPMLKLKLLQAMTGGSFKELHDMLQKEFVPYDDPSVMEVSTLLLHYAVQVAPIALIKEIVRDYVVRDPFHLGLHKTPEGDITVNLNINYRDYNGNTPLHLAASQSRVDVVNFLMELPDINDTIVNNAGQEPIDMCKTLDIVAAMQNKRDEYVSQVAQDLRDAFDRRDFDKLEQIWKIQRNEELLDINGLDPTSGDTVLHEFVKKKDVQMCKWLVDHGADPLRRNAKALLPIDLLGPTSPSKHQGSSSELRNYIETVTRDRNVVNVSETDHQTHAPTYKGQLKKWTNIAKGFQTRWFVLSEDGYLRYYKNRPKEGSSPRDKVHLSKCRLFSNSHEKVKFELLIGDQGRWRLKGTNPAEAKKWIATIQAGISYANAKHSQKQPSNRSVISGSANEGQSRSAPSLQPAKPNRSRANSSTSQRISQVQKGLKPPVLGISTDHSNYGSNASDAESVVGSLNINTNRLRRDMSPLTPMSNSLNSPILKDESFNSPTLESLLGKDKLNAIDPYAKDSDEDIDEILVKPIDPDEEYLKTQYGPFIENLNVYKKTISMQLASVLEVLDTTDISSSDLSTLRGTIQNTVDTFNNLAKLGAERDRKLVQIITKHRDVNNVWIDSVKELELELNKKEDLLEALTKERRHLRKELNQELQETADQDNKMIKRASTVISRFLNVTKSVVEDGNGDEFYDAEELIDEIGSIPDTTPGEMSEAKEMREQIKTMVPEQPAESKVEHEETSEKKEVEQAETKPAPEQKAISKEQEKMEAIKEQTSKPTDEESTLRETATSTASVKGESNEIELQRKLFASSKMKSQTESQKAKEKLLLEEGSFFGYDEGVRKRLKLDEDDRPKISLWGVLKSMVGKDMTKMTLPVAFNEPTSLLQRVAEDLEYSELLDKAVQFEDSTLRLLYVSIFTASAYASTTKRVAKPFNPLLGETFEYARPDKQYRFFAEQVSHHPPISATYTESPRWDFWGESYVDTHFNGRQFNVKHLGLWYINLLPNSTDHKELYTFKKPNNNVIGILVGNPQVDNYGEVVITNHTTGDYCKLYFKARGWRSSSAYEVKGEVFDKDNKKHWVLGGHWHDSIYAKHVNGKDKDEIALDHKKTHTATEPTRDGSKFLVWKVNPRPDAPFHLTPFAITLNAPQKHLIPWLAPTDTRLRPDQRAMEDGQYDLAAEEKHRVEEKQRAARRTREEQNIQYKPLWFTKETHPVTKKPYWKFHGDYWQQRKNHQLKGKADIF